MINRKDFKKIKNDILNGPRLTVLLKHFEYIAQGKTQRVKNTVKPSDVFLSSDTELKKYYKVYKKNLGTFNHHGIASIPYVLEECLRTGVAINRYSRWKYKESSDYLTFYGTSCADGTHARTIAEYADGKIYTITDSPNAGNKKEFERLINHKYSFFHLGSFADITPYYLKYKAPIFFRKGFDIIWENTTFQMHGNNRDDQISYIKRVLKNDGLIIFLEKMNNDNKKKYEEMEKIKDLKFKSKYFDVNDIKKKKTTILQEMEKGQVTLREFFKSLDKYFRYSCIIWNSTNFYEIVASNNKESIEKFIYFLPNVYLPREFVYKNLNGSSRFEFHS